jgi:hypothetical protein
MKIWKRAPSARTRVDNVRAMVFPDTFRQKILETHPYADADTLREWENGFRRYILLNLLKPATMSMLAMPSEAVDSVWHAALLHTRWYAKMCNDCLGWFMHHEPFPSESSPKTSSDVRAALTGVANTYVLECAIEGVAPDIQHLPLMFRLDQEYNVANGYHYGTTAMVEAGLAEVDIAKLYEYIYIARKHMTAKEVLRIRPFMDQGIELQANGVLMHEHVTMTTPAAI